MGVSLKLANVWRIIREVDLEAIRQTANAPFELWLIDDIAETGHITDHRIGTDARELAPIGGDAVRLRAALSADPRVPPPALRVVPASGLGDHVLPAAAIVLAPEGLSPAIDVMLNRLRRGKVPTVIVVRGDAGRDDRIISAVERHVYVPTIDATGIGLIGTALVAVVPADLRLALARQLPPLRPAVFEQIIDETARANASYSLTSGLAEVVPLLTIPLNLGDMVVLTKNQLVMAYRLVLAGGRDGEPKALLREILGVLGGGLIFRQLARQLVGMIPVAGLVPKVAIAYGGTWAIGRAVVLWVTEGREVTSDLVRSLSTEGLQRGRTVATRLLDTAKIQTGRAGARWERLRDHLPLLRRRR
jgi:uncharacterized protein (DUF697 family)